MMATSAGSDAWIITGTKQQVLYETKRKERKHEAWATSIVGQNNYIYITVGFGPTDAMTSGQMIHICDLRSL